VGQSGLSRLYDQLPVRVLHHEVSLDPGADREPIAGQVVGSGILLSATHLLTCAHVVAVALGIPEDQEEMPGDWVPLDLPLCGDAPGARLAEVVGWYPLKTKASAGSDLEDVALLKLREPIEDWAPDPLWSGWQEGDYYNKPFLARGFGKPEGSSETGVCLGVTDRGWIELRPGQKEIGEGYSGGPVFDPATAEIIGMLVAYYPRERITYLIPTRRLLQGVPRWLVQAEPLESLLGKTVDREEQIGQLQKRKVLADGDSSAPPDNECVVFECCVHDEPAFFAQQVILAPFFYRNRRPSVSLRGLTPVVVDPKQTGVVGFSTALGDAVGGDVAGWLAQGTHLKVVYVETRLGWESRAVIRGIRDYLDGFARRSPQQRLVVLVGCRVDGGKSLARWLYRHWALFGGLRERILLLDPLRPFGTDRLVTWADTLPTTYSQEFHMDKIKQAFIELLPENEKRPYESLAQGIVDTLAAHRRHSRRASVERSL